MNLGVSFPGKVLAVTDGDTLKIQVPAWEASIRLLDCWAPETRTRDEEEKRRGFAAKNYLHDLCHGRDVEIQIPIDFDGKFGDSLSFGRMLARVTLDGRDLSELMVAAGHATKEKS